MAGQMTIGEQVIPTRQTGVPNHARPYTAFTGFPAADHDVWVKASAFDQCMLEVFAAHCKAKGLLE